MERDIVPVDTDPEVASVSSGSYLHSHTNDALEGVSSEYESVAPSLADARDLLSISTDQDPLPLVSEHEHGHINISFLLSDEEETPLNNTPEAESEPCDRVEINEGRRSDPEEEPRAFVPSYREVKILDKAAEAELDARLNELAREREAIMNMSHRDMTKELAKLREIRETTLENAHAERVYLRAEARAHLQTAVKNVNAEFVTAKGRLRESMLAEKVALHKRTQSLVEEAADEGEVRLGESCEFVENMAKSGLITLALTPDEINADLSRIVQATRIEQLRKMVSSETVSESSVEETSREA